MPKISRKSKEAIKTTLFLVVVAVLFVVYIIYPLNRTKAIMARADIDDFDSDSLTINDAAAWVEAGLSPDTFRVDTDGQVSIACLFVPGMADSAGVVRGTVCLLHADKSNRDTLLPAAQALVEHGWNVIAYDQRATRLSTGKYHGDGTQEASDLVEVIRWLDLRERIVHPLIVAGFELGGDAALLAAREDSRIDRMVAIDPYLTTLQMWDRLRDRHDTYWFPLFRSTMSWWYEMRSSYAAPTRKIDDIKPVTCPTLLLTAPERTDGPELVRLVELSGPQMLTVDKRPFSLSDLAGTIEGFRVLTEDESSIGQ